MTETTPTLRTLLDVPAESDPNRLPDGWKPFRERLGQEVSSVKWTASMPDLTAKIAELLDIQIPGLFLTTWKKAAEVRTKIEQSRLKPNDVMYVELAKHKVTTSHKPYITVQLGKMPEKKAVTFTVTASFTLNGFVLKIQNGEIREIRSGTCEAAGKLEGLGIVLAEKKAVPLAFPGTIAVAAPA